MQPSPPPSPTTTRVHEHHSDSGASCSADLPPVPFHAAVPPLTLPNGRPSLARTISQIEMASSRSSSPHTPPSQLPDSPERPTFHELPISKSEKKLNRQARKFILSRFPMQDPTTISAEYIAMKVDIIARHKIQEDIRRSPEAAVTLDSVVDHFQLNDFLISNIQRRLGTLRSLIEEFAALHGARTQRMKELHNDISLLMATSHLKSFINYTMRICQGRDRESKKRWEILKLAFEDQKGKYENVIAILNRWTSPTEAETRIIQQHIIYETKINAIVGIEIPWEELPGTAFPIDNILSDDPLRAIFPYDRVLFNSITINGMPFHSASAPYTKTTQPEFFFDLLKELYRAGFAVKRDREIHCDVHTLLTALGSGMEKDVIRAFLKSHPLPVLDLLRPYTMSCWAHADIVFRNRFKALFDEPYTAKLQQGMDCEFHIKGPTNHFVTQRKSYSVYHRLTALSVYSSPTPDTTRKICTVTVEWTIGKGPDGWKGRLVVTGFKWDSQPSTTKQRKIADIFIPQKLELYTGPSVRRGSDAAAASSSSAAALVMEETVTDSSQASCSSGSYDPGPPPIVPRLRRRESPDTPRTTFESNDKITRDRAPS